MNNNNEWWLIIYRADESTTIQNSLINQEQ